jgi:hypothetical protein
MHWQRQGCRALRVRREGLHRHQQPPGSPGGLFVRLRFHQALCSVGLPSNETRQGPLDWIPTRHSNHVTALERDGWDD